MAVNTTLPAFCQRRAGPRLKKLYLLWGIQIYGSKKLLVDADALSELILLEIVESNLLKHNTTNLRVLRINDCVVGLGALSIFAPRMKEVTFLDNYAESELIEGDFSRVSRLELELYSHRHTDVNDIRVSLLQRCTSATCLQ